MSFLIEPLILLSVLGLVSAASLTLFRYPAVALGLFSFVFVLRGGQTFAGINITITLLLTLILVVSLQVAWRRLSFRLTGLDICVIGLSFTIILGAAMSDHMMLSLIKAAKFSLLVAIPYFFARIIVINERQVSKLMWAIIIVAMVVATYVVFQRLAGNADRIAFFDANQIAVGMLLMVAILSLVPYVSFSDRTGLVATFLVILCTTALFMTGTRGPVISIGIAMLPYAFGLWRRRRYKRLLAMALLVVVGAVALLNGFMQDTLISERFETVWGEDQDRSVRGREELHAVAIEMFRENMVFGAGTSETEIVADYPHNIVLEIAAENGLAGLVWLIPITWLIAVKTWRYVAGGYNEEWLASMVVLMPLIALVVEAQISTNLIGHKALFIYLGMMVNLELIARNRHHNESPEQESAAPELNAFNYRSGLNARPL